MYDCHVVAFEPDVCETVRMFENELKFGAALLAFATAVIGLIAQFTKNKTEKPD